MSIYSHGVSLSLSMPAVNSAPHTLLTPTPQTERIVAKIRQAIHTDSPEIWSISHQIPRYYGKLGSGAQQQLFSPRDITPLAHHLVMAVE